MAGPHWNYAVLLVTQQELAALVKEHTQYTLWPKQGDKQFVVFPVQDAAFEVLKKHPGYTTDDLAVIRRDYKTEMAANVSGNTLDATGAPVIPMAYAGEHQRQITASKGAIHA